MDYEIAKDAVKDAIENRRLNNLCYDKGLLEALRIINYCQTEEEESTACDWLILKKKM